LDSRYRTISSTQVLTGGLALGWDSGWWRPQVLTYTTQGTKPIRTHAQEMLDPGSAEDQRRFLHISEEEARAKLAEVFEVSGCARPLLAVDLDDVLCQTTNRVAECASLSTSTI